MLDIKLIRTEPDTVKERLAARLSDTSAIDKVLDIDKRLRAAKNEVETLKAQLNASSKQIGVLMREGKKDEAEAAKETGRKLGEQIAVLDEQTRSLESEIDELLFHIPNLPHVTTPPGPEENFQIVRTVGEPRQFDFEPKAHWDIAADLDLIDFVRGTKISGSGFILYKGIGAALERGLIQFMLDMHVNKHGYTEYAPPFFVSRASVRASAHLPKFAPEMYHDDEDDLFALPTAEPALANIHRDEILDGRDLPLKYTAYSPCWRREAGAAGKDTRGLLRVHQFDKVEMFQYALPDTSYEAQEAMLADATDVLTTLGIPYRVKLLAAGDISFAATKCYDVEIYAPGVGAWLEVSSVSNCEDFQARRGNIRFRREPGAKPEFPHLLNGSGTALPRLVATLLETYQNADGSVTVPEALRPYLGGREAMRKG
jgi:seryl-tRNA synthetase